MAVAPRRGEDAVVETAPPQLLVGGVPHAAEAAAQQRLHLPPRRAAMHLHHNLPDAPPILVRDAAQRAALGPLNVE
eukprot:CAMPEP_0196696854 /NCGR_PEP_ID=MMETSP1090-20130531/40399_1 /TAXON_ID=37098 /ORGANISM="Isochrysis sp, Strain CCMP1244" /LENGTH=75 /DNA_ID=CAMNT_0042036453 /DNA_START=97 /DNA_END=322 /DNA_ORIENTATION=-